MMDEEEQKLVLQGLDAPIPGESLTGPPGGQPWEKPAQFSKPEEALDFIVGRLESKGNAEKAAIFMDSGVPVEDIAQVVAFNGFVEGRWTPDVSELIKPAIIVRLLHIAMKAGVEPYIRSQEEEEELPDTREIRKMYNPESIGELPNTPVEDLPQEEMMAEATVMQGEAPQEAPASTGFMGMASGGMG